MFNAFTNNAITTVQRDTEADGVKSVARIRIEGGAPGSFSDESMAELVRRKGVKVTLDVRTAKEYEEETGRRIRLREAFETQDRAIAAFEAFMGAGQLPAGQNKELTTAEQAA